MAHLVPRVRVAPLQQRKSYSAPSLEQDADADLVRIPATSTLNDVPDLVLWRIQVSARDGGPTLKDVYGEQPNHWVVTVLRHGAASYAGVLAQNITNKAVISALLLTFNYPALTAAADDAYANEHGEKDDPLFRAYFFFQMSSVIMSVLVMISAAIFVSHVLRCGQHVDSLINYLNTAIWVDNALNEFAFICQCMFTFLAIILYLWLSWPAAMAWTMSAMTAVSVVVLVGVLLWSTRLFHVAARNEWKEMVEAEAAYRTLAARTRGGGTSDGKGAGSARKGAAIGDAD